MGFAEAFEIPPSGAVFTFGRSRFAGNEPSQFFIRNDPVIQISCGDEHTVLICEGGRAFAFGSNDSGQLGLGHNRPIDKPMCIKTVKPWPLKHAACGKSHTLLFSRCGKLFACGANAEGQLGTGDKEPRHSPVEIQINLKGCSIVALAAGCHHSALLTDNGDIWTWGCNADGQCGVEATEAVLLPTLVLCQGEPTAAKSLACGYYHTVFSRDDGVWTMGETDNGKLGREVEGSENTTPQKACLPEDLNARIVQVAAGGSHTMVLTDDGKVYGFGSNWCGQIGAGTEQEYGKATTVEIPNTVTSVHCGESHTLFIAENGEVYSCGDARHGKLCRDGGAKSPELVSVLSPYVVKGAACGGCHSMILAWNRELTEMDATTLPPLKPRPSIVNGLTGDSVDLEPETISTRAQQDEESPAEADQDLPPDYQKRDDNEEIEIMQNGNIMKSVLKEEEEDELSEEVIEEETKTNERSKTATIEKPRSTASKIANVFRRKPKVRSQVGDQNASKACTIL